MSQTLSREQKNNSEALCQCLVAGGPGGQKLRHAPQDVPDSRVVLCNQQCFQPPPTSLGRGSSAGQRTQLTPAPPGPWAALATGEHQAGWSRAGDRIQAPFLQDRARQRARVQGEPGTTSNESFGSESQSQSRGREAPRPRRTCPPKLTFCLGEGPSRHFLLD